MFKFVEIICSLKHVRGLLLMVESIQDNAIWPALDLRKGHFNFKKLPLVRILFPQLFGKPHLDNLGIDY